MVRQQPYGIVECKAYGGSSGGGTRKGGQMAGEIKALPRAASVVLLREGEGDAPFEVYMLRRLDSARFAPGAHSFPGGVLDASDYAVASAAIHALPGGLTVTATHA